MATDKRNPQGQPQGDRRPNAQPSVPIRPFPTEQRDEYLAEAAQASAARESGPTPGGAPLPAEAPPQGASRALTARGQLRQQMFASTPSSLSEASRPAQAGEATNAGGAQAGPQGGFNQGGFNQGGAGVGSGPTPPAGGAAPFAGFGGAAPSPTPGGAPPFAGFGTPAGGAPGAPPFGAPAGGAPPFGAPPGGLPSTPPFGAPPGGAGGSPFAGFSAPPSAFGAPGGRPTLPPNASFGAPPGAPPGALPGAPPSQSAPGPSGASGPFGGLPAGPKPGATPFSNDPQQKLPAGFAASSPPAGQAPGTPNFGPVGARAQGDFEGGGAEDGALEGEEYGPDGELRELALTDDPRLWEPIDVPTTPRAQQRAYRTLASTRLLNQDLAQPNLRKTSFQGDHYDPIDPDELDPLKSAMQQRHVRRRHNAPEEFNDEMFAWSISGYSMAHAEDRLRSLRNTVWIPECYVKREGVDEVFGACAKQGRRALLVSGDEGSGKTSLVTQWLDGVIDDNRRRAQVDPTPTGDGLHNYQGDVIVFLHGRSDYQGPASLSAEELLCEIIARKTYLDQRFDRVSDLVERLMREVMTPDPIKPFYARRNSKQKQLRSERKVWIILDGIDDADRFQELFKVIDDQLAVFTQSPQLQLIVSLRWGSYQLLSKRQMGERPAKTDVFQNSRYLFNPEDLLPDGYEIDTLTDFREGFPGVYVRPFSLRELKVAYHTRQRYRPARACTMSYERIQDPLTSLLRNPQRLNLYHDVFKGREHAPTTLTPSALFDNYIRGLGRHFPNAVSWVHKIAKQMYEHHSSMIDPEPMDGGRLIPIDKIASNTGALQTVMRPNDEGQGRSLVGYSFSIPGLYEHLLYLHLKNQIAPRPRPNGDDLRQWGTEVIDPMGIQLVPLLDAVTLITLELVDEGDEAPLVPCLEIPHRHVRNHLLIHAMRRLGVRNQGSEAGRKALRRFMEAWSEHALQNGLESAFLEPLADALRQLTEADCHEAAALMASHADHVVQAMIKAQPDELIYRKFLSQFMRVRGTIDHLSGRVPDAIQSLERALESEQKLAKDEPSVRHLKQLSESLSKMGLLHQEVGDMEQSLVCFRYTSLISKTLADEVPTLPHVMTYIESLNRLGVLHQELENFDDALDDFYQAIHRGRQSLKRRVSNSLRELISQSLQRAGAIHQHLDEFEEATRCFEESISLETAMVDSDPSVERVRMLCMTLNYLASLHRVNQDFDEAFSVFHRSRELLEGQLKTDADRFLCRAEICDTLNQIGELHGDLGELEQALAYFEKVLDLHKLIVKEDQGAEVRKDLSAALVKVGDIHQALDHNDDALDYFQQALEVSRALMEQHPSIPHRRNWVFTLCRIAEIYKLFGELEESMHLLERAQGTYQNLIIELPTILHRKELSITLGQLGDLYQHFQRGEQALDCFQRALTLNEEILQEEPYLDHQRDLGILYVKVGDIHQEMNRAGLAIGCFQRALELQRELVELDPIPLHRRELYLTLSRIGEMYHAFHQYESALASYHAAMEINKELISEMATTNRRHEQSLLHIKVGDVYKDHKRYEEAFQSYHFALASYQELAQEAPIPLHHRGLQTAFSRINALKLQQQRLTAIPATPEVMQEFHMDGRDPSAPWGAGGGVRAPSMDRLGPVGGGKPGY